MPKKAVGESGNVSLSWWLTVILVGLAIADAGGPLEDFGIPKAKTAAIHPKMQG